jgi:dTDP-glucose 4,6-dehydratase
MRLLVTGGAGFIGSCFVRMALRGELAGAEIERLVVLDALTYAGNLANLEPIADDPRYAFRHAEIQCAEAVDEAIRAFEIDTIVNFAAESHNDRSILDSGSFIQTDVYGVYVLLEAVRRHQMRRFLHVSTDEVYGTIATGAFTEDSPIQPNTPYSASKAGGDLQCRAHHKAFGTPVVVTRGGNNYGPYQYPEKLIPFFAVRLLQGKKVPLYGDGSQVREWIHVADHCEGIWTALLRGAPGEIYNIGDANERSNREVVRILLEETGRGEELIKSIPDPRKGAHDLRYAMATDKIRALGWQPRRPFETELRHTVRWYREHADWWQPIVENPAYQDFVARFYGSSLGEDL